MSSYGTGCGGGRRRHNVQRLAASGKGLLAFSAFNAYTICMQYTIRNVPDYLDAALRAFARARGKSLNDVTLEALVRGAGLSAPRSHQRDLHDIAGSWLEDPAFDSALAAQDTIDPEMWR